MYCFFFFFFFSSRRRHTRLQGDWSSDVCSSDLAQSSPGSYDLTTGWCERWKCLVACLLGEESQQPTCPQDMHSRRWTHSPPLAQPDRKSTRLNSSHLVISYAVFCLKKKKQTPQRGASRAGHSWRRTCRFARNRAGPGARS